MKNKHSRIYTILLTALMVFSSVSFIGRNLSAEENASVPKISVMVDHDKNITGIEDLFDYAEEELNIKIDVELRPGGAEGDNFIKTRLASGEITDLTCYNSGSKFIALNPEKYFYDITNEPFVENLDDTFKQCVSVDGAVYGVPVSSTSAGAVIYYKPHYAELGLDIPHTWEDFLDNCEALQEAGIDPIIATYGESWTTQVTYLGDHYNVLAKKPNFAEKFEAGEAKYANEPAGIESFQKLADQIPYYRDDYLVAKYSDGIDMLAQGEGTHWIMLTQVLASIEENYPGVMDDIGVFGVPGDDPENHGLTVWQADAWYLNKESENIDTALSLMELFTLPKGLEIIEAGTPGNGPFPIKGYTMSDATPRAVREDMQAYFDEGLIQPALEFQTSVKGPNCEQICQEVASGQISAEEAAEAYDEDCRKQALQLGLDWE